MAKTAATGVNAGVRCCQTHNKGLMEYLPHEAESGRTDMLYTSTHTQKRQKSGDGSLTCQLAVKVSVGVINTYNQPTLTKVNYSL